MSKTNEEPIKKPLDIQEAKPDLSTKPIDKHEVAPDPNKKQRLSGLKKFIDSIINRLIPDFAPKLEIDEKLIDDEYSKDYALIRYYSELQILLGISILAIGGIGLAVDIIFILVCCLGVILILTGFEIEEIYVTNVRLLIRRIGLLERIIRIPSDEEHLLRHVVSFHIGRAPTQKVLMTLAAIGLVAG
ncbi:MAG: hypothetical protein ACW99Q_19155, partial [Candidatus Kariarchaeaceae archaeon]